METVMLAPTSPAALFYGKAVANTLQLVLLGLIGLLDRKGEFPLPPCLAFGEEGLRERRSMPKSCLFSADLCLREL